MMQGTTINSGDTHFEVFNPANGALLGVVDMHSEAQVSAAIQRAQQAQTAWAARGDEARCALLNQVADALEAHAEKLALWITREQGKPLNGLGSRFEMQACVGWTRAATVHAVPEEVVFEDATRRDVMLRVPRGVIAAVAPWNWPLMIAIWQIMPALRMGNAVVLKPSEYTSLATLEMVKVINEILPEGLLNVVTGAGEVGGWLTSSQSVDKIMFTGSEATGRKIIQASAANLAPITLELGGNDAAIVLPGAPIDELAEGIFWGAFINMGQTCACAKRLYVHADDVDAVVAALSAQAAAMTIGDGVNEAVTFGPLQNRMQYDKVRALVEDSRRNGHKVIEIGEHPDTGFFMPITLVTDIEDGARLVDEEQFGPVLPIITYTDLDAAVAAANRLGAGLGASVWGDANAALGVAGRMEAGTVWVNQHGAIHPMVPFGGAKDSGYGVEFGLDGLKAVSQHKVVSLKK